MTMGNARMAVQLAALRSPNPYVRETVHDERDEDWTIDPAGRTLTVKIQGLEEKVATGKFVCDPGLRP